MHINYKMLTVGLVLAAILVTFLTTAVMATSDGPELIDNSGSVSYDAQNGYGQQNCQGTCDGCCQENCQGTCNGDCDQNKEQGSGQCDCSGDNRCQGSAAKYNNRSCNGTCLGN